MKKCMIMKGSIVPSIEIGFVIVPVSHFTSFMVNPVVKE